MSEFEKKGAEDNALREKEEAEVRERVEVAQARVSQKTDEPNMKGLNAFGWEDYERQNARR